MVLIPIQWSLFSPLISLIISMVHFSTKLSFDIALEFRRLRETAKTISKVLRVAKEITRTRLLKR